MILREIVQLHDFGDGEVVGREQMDRRGIRRVPERVTQLWGYLGGLARLRVWCVTLLISPVISRVFRRTQAFY